MGMSDLYAGGMYGPFTNERLVGRAIRDRRDGVVRSRGRKVPRRRS
jgi:hypothetical protein